MGGEVYPRLRDGALASAPAGQPGGACPERSRRVPPPSGTTPPFAEHRGGEDARRANRRDASAPPLRRVSVLPRPLRVIQPLVGAANEVARCGVGASGFGDAEGDRAANRPFV